MKFKQTIKTAWHNSPLAKFWRWIIRIQLKGGDFKK